MKYAVAVTLALALAACGGESRETGSIDLNISGPGGASGALTQALTMATSTGTADAKAQIQSVWVSFESASYFGDYQQIQTTPGGAFPITGVKREDLLAGTYTVCAYAASKTGASVNFATDVLYKSCSDVVVSDRHTSSVNLVMQQVVAPGSVNVTAPFISAITITGTNPPVIGKPVHLAATVSASPSPTYLWTVSCPGDFTFQPFTSKSSLATDLVLNFCEADAIVTFSVTDPSVPETSGAITSTVQFVLHYVPQGIDVPSIDVNSWPNITSIGTSSNAQPLPGETVALVAVASDPEGDSFTSTWSDSCGGSFANGSTLTPIWTAPNTPYGECVLMLTLQEAGNENGHNAGHNSATFTLHVGAVTQPVFSTIPAVFPLSVPSQAFQAQQTSEFGDSIALGGTGRHAVSATVMMVTWAQTAAPSFPITLNLYAMDGSRFATVDAELRPPGGPGGRSRPVLSGTTAPASSSGGPPSAATTASPSRSRSTSPGSRCPTPSPTVSRTTRRPTARCPSARTVRGIR